MNTAKPNSGTVDSGNVNSGRAMRSIRYQAIADELRRRVRSAAPGSVLPSESELSAEFAASRVTVRRALELCATTD